MSQSRCSETLITVFPYGPLLTPVLPGNLLSHLKRFTFLTSFPESTTPVGVGFAPSTDSFTHLLRESDTRHSEGTGTQTRRDDTDPSLVTTRGTGTRTSPPTLFPTETPLTKGNPQSSTPPSRCKKEGVPSTTVSTLSSRPTPYRK